MNRRFRRFGTLFFYPMRFLAMGHVTRRMFKKCKQTRCQRNIFFYLNFFCFCSIIFYSYAIVLFLLYFVENRTVPIRSVSNGYCILDQNRTVRWIEPYRTVKKKPEWIFALILADEKKKNDIKKSIDSIKNLLCMSALFMFRVLYFCTFEFWLFVFILKYKIAHVSLNGLEQRFRDFYLCL